MGYRCRWLAVPASRDRERLLKRLKFAVKGELIEAVYDTGLYLVALPDWLVIMGDGWDFMDLVEREQVRRLSSEGEDAIYFYTDDTPMHAELTGFHDGIEAWTLQFTDALDQGGKPPAPVKTAIAAGKADIYDALANAGLALVGFRHDQTLSSGDQLPIVELVKA
jgi:hypothetical protein